MMADINSINPFPQGIGPVEQDKTEKTSSPQSQTQNINFQSELMRALGQINQEADQVADASSSNYENVQNAMDAAKTAFTDTMQAHQMMQHFIQNSIQPQGNSEADGDKNKDQ
ncbi:MAG: hypothetical protein JXR73_10185 [Candidatus Omnitrophica bacterium]|nr:hypothetical protein [Candidatus Omnitrophota bacterium]